MFVGELIHEDWFQTQKIEGHKADNLIRCVNRIFTSDEIKIQFIQPLPFTLKKVKNILRQNKYKLKNASNSFRYNEEILQ